MSTTENAHTSQNGVQGASNSQPGAQSADLDKELQLDVTKLHSLPSEQQELFLLSFSSDLLRHVETADHESLIADQKNIKKELIKILGLGAPVPNRVIRNTLGLTFSTLFTKGNRSLLYETINELVVIVGAGKNEQDLKTKHAAAVSLGYIFEEVGDSAITLSSLTISTLIKLLKSAQSHAGLRGALYKALGSVVGGVESSLDEQVARDLWKHARNAAAGDKGAYPQKKALWCIEQLVTKTPYFQNANDFESLKTTLWKAVEQPSAAVRHAAASCLAATLVRSYVEDGAKESVSRSRKSKKSSKKQHAVDDEEHAIERSESPAPKKAATLLLLTLKESLKVLSAQYMRATGAKAKTAIAVAYKLVIIRLPEKVIEDQYATIADHLFTELLGTPSITYNRHRLLITRKFVSIILRDTVGSKILGESAKLIAAQWLINNVLKDYPQVVAERREPSKQTLIATLDALSGLIADLGSASSLFAESCREALFQVIQHPGYTVQIHAAHCFRAYVVACPQQLLPSAELCLKELKKELENMKGPRRCVGYANALAAMLSTSRSQPLYGSLDLFSRTLSLATELFKASSDSELRVSAAQIQVAWVLIGGLMPLGPNFVKIHLSQLLLLWKNALPKPLTRENFAQRGALEMSFLAHVRECALGALLVFIEYNNTLITTDGARRIAAMLQNTIYFLEGLPSVKSTEEISNRLLPSLQLRDFAIMVRRRVLQCYGKLTSVSMGSNAEVISQSNVLGMAISSFMDPELDVPKSLENSMAVSANNFEGLCDMGDNSGAGITSLLCGYRFKPLSDQSVSPSNFSHVSNASVMAEFEDFIRSPICSSKEHDSVLLYSTPTFSTSWDAAPPSNEVVNAAITLFALALPLQAPKVQESSLEELVTLLQANSRQREPAKKAAVAINVASALLYTLVVATRETSAPAGNFSSAAVQKLIQDVIRSFLLETDPYVRHLAAQALGRLASIAGSQFTNAEVHFLVDAIVGNRSPDARAGCSLALGSIYTHIGGMAAGLHLKTMVGVLLSLCADPHPVVHFWAIEALGQVAENAGLSFSGYATSTLGMVAQLYASDTHSEEAESLTTSNIEVEYSSTAALSKIVDSIINVLGPDLQDMSKPRKLILTLMNLIRHEEDIYYRMQSTLYSRHILLYAPSFVDTKAYISTLRTNLASTNETLRKVSTEGLNDVMKRDAAKVIFIGGDGFGEDIWAALDSNPQDSNLQQLVLNWLHQTAMTDTAIWVTRCQDVLAKTKKKAEVAAPSQQAADAPGETLDEEVAGFAAAAAAAQGESAAKASEGQEFLKWQTRRFAMLCLIELLSTVAKEMLPDQPIPAEIALQGKIADIVRMAFSASTANVVELRVLGLRVINQVLQLFGRTPDPDFTEASLLEQYQAQIGSALTPAFTADSSPELASEAINVCATFVATGIVTNVERMGRIFKLLSTGVENVSHPAQAGTVGDLLGLTSNARVMLRMALLSAWAQLQVSSMEQQYLEDIVHPYAAKLTPLWLSSLQEYARLRFEPEISSTLGSDSFGDNLDDLYAAFNRETLLGYYEDVWLHLINAISTLVDKDSGFVFDALDGKANIDEQANEVAPLGGKDIRYRDEPVAFFFILYGLAFEALVREARIISAQTHEILVVLKKILKPAVSGTSIYQDTIFNESMDTLDRLALTGTTPTQTVIVDIVRNLSLSHVSAQSGEDREDKLSDDIDQLFELTRIMLLILSGLIPTLDDPPSSHSRPLVEDSIALIRSTLESLVDVADVFPSIIRADLYACIVHTFATILSTGACQARVVPEAFPLFKRFVETIVSTKSDTASRLVRGCLQQFLTILTRAQRRDSEYSLPCAKNTLLALTILLTSAGKVLSPKDPLIFKALAEVQDCLYDLGLSKVAANCVRSFLLVTPKSQTDESICRQLYPYLLHFVNNTEAEDPENAKSLVLHALTTNIAVLTSQQGKLAAMSIIMPTLLHRASTEGESFHAETAQRLLELLTADQTVFRHCLSNIEAKQKSLVEKILMAGGGTGGRKQSGSEESEEESKPSIALRMDF